jgi:AraC-like DNA-binding protein
MPTAPKNAAQGWVSARHLQHMIVQGEAAGVAMDALLAVGGLGRADLADPDGLVPLSAIDSMLAALALYRRDPLVGLHLARHIQPATFGAIGLLFQSCTTLVDALETVVRYNGLLSNIGATSLVFGPGTVEVRWECLAGGEALRRHASEYVLGIFVTLARLLLPNPPQDFLHAVYFAHPAPRALASSGEYFAFFGAPVHFNRPFTGLILPATALITPLRHGDALLRDVLEHHAQELMQRRAQAVSPVAATRQLIATLLLDGMPSKEAVAAQLGMSGRTLHRRLHEADTSFQLMLDAVRLELAQKRLLESSDTLALIADKLGFSSHQDFLRWYKHSTGETPGDFRKRQDATHAA